jgi:hypothetical protein
VLIDVHDVALGHTTKMRWNEAGEWIYSDKIAHARPVGQPGSLLPVPVPRRVRPGQQAHLLITAAGQITATLRGAEPETISDAYSKLGIR